MSDAEPLGTSQARTFAQVKSIPPFPPFFIIIAPSTRVSAKTTEAPGPQDLLSKDSVPARNSVSNRGSRLQPTGTFAIRILGRDSRPKYGSARARPRHAEPTHAQCPANAANTPEDPLDITPPRDFIARMRPLHTDPFAIKVTWAGLRPTRRQTYSKLEL
ncbi:hypothetical protein E4U38_002505 [Claviceps purpurea]|nr:hypothetical protein E4U38_002505 [Claviceps purpurea]